MRRSVMELSHVFKVALCQKQIAVKKGKALHHRLWQTRSLVASRELPKLIKMYNLVSNNGLGHRRNLHFPERRQRAASTRISSALV